VIECDREAGVSVILKYFQSVIYEKLAHGFSYSARGEHGLQHHLPKKNIKIDEYSGTTKRQRPSREHGVRASGGCILDFLMYAQAK